MPLTNPPLLSAFAVSNTTQSSAGMLLGYALSINGAGIASVGVSNSSIIISVPAGGGGGDGGVFAGVSTMGNTAGSTGTVSTGNLVFVGTDGISLSQSTGAAGSDATITLRGAAPLRRFELPAEAGNVEAFHGQGSLHFMPFGIPSPGLQFDRVGQRIRWNNSSNSTGSVTFSLWCGIYTRNASTLSLLHSQSTTRAITFSGTVGNNSLQLGLRNFTMGWTQTLQPDDYWMGVAWRTTTGGGNGTIQQLCANQLATAWSGIFGAASNATAQRQLGQGHYTASTSGIPGSVGFSQINGSATLAMRYPQWFLLSQTA